MAGSIFTDQINPEVIEAAIGQSWANDTKLMKFVPQIFIKDSRPITQGSLLSVVRNKFFQGTTGQAVAADSTIASVGRVQTKENHPVIWRYGSIDEDDVISEIIPDAQGAMDANAEYAEAGRQAAAQWLEDSIFNTIEGVGGALTSNQAGAGATATLALLVAGKAALSDMGIDLNGGAALMRSELYWMLVGLGVIAATSNTFGNAAQDEMVRNGIMPSTVLGAMALAVDKLSAAPGTDHYLYFVGPQSIVLRASNVPEIEFGRKTALKAFGTIMNLKVKFSAGLKGVSWNAAGSDSLSDTDLQTAANWTLADTDSKYVRIARVLTDNN